MASDAPVLVVGGTGALGAQVVSALLARDLPVRALVRPASNAERLEQAGVQIVRGDLMDPASLVRAIDGADSVVTSAAGYTRHTKGDDGDIDTIGNRNLVDAASQVGVRRFVLTSVLTCDQAVDVPHFWHKKLVEDRLAEKRVPFVSLRPGAFLDSLVKSADLSKGRLNWVGNPDAEFTCVLSADVADALALAVDAPGVDGEILDLGWDQPVTMNGLARILAEQSGQAFAVRTIPAGLVNGADWVLGRFKPRIKDVAAMLRYINSGRYVADTTRQGVVFGAVPTAEEAVSGFLKKMTAR
ncbi:NAD(P)H-binding protein [Streptomyces sp. GbtcB7]|uniref:NmrA family NAD(P)-binding protein n=1 Tax=Streptomyces sp. GbtcB7 TaxID=2824752 RepID=UPI001C30E0D4|nr:NAD(P)H-binding protein [Streptomyces sp. GbtcB7]